MRHQPDEDWDTTLTLPALAREVPAIREQLNSKSMRDGTAKGTLAVTGHLEYDEEEDCLGDTLDPLMDTLQTVGIPYDYFIEGIYQTEDTFHFFRPGASGEAGVRGATIADEDGAPLVSLAALRKAAAKNGGTIVLADFLKAQQLPQETLAAWAESHRTSLENLQET